MNSLEEADSDTALPVWTAFGDLMAGLLGAFVLILVSVLGLQFELSTRLEDEIRQRQAQTQRLQTLEQALAGPLAGGRVTLQDGRIGINGSVLFELSSAELQPEGRAWLSRHCPVAAAPSRRQARRATPPQAPHRHPRPRQQISRTPCWRRPARKTCPRATRCAGGASTRWPSVRRTTAAPRGNCWTRACRR